MSNNKSNKPHGPMNVGEKPKNFKKSIGKLLKYCKSYWWAIGIACALAMLGAILNVIGPDYVKQITDELINAMGDLAQGIAPRDANLDLIWEVGLFLIIIYVAGAICNLSEGLIMATATNKVSRKMRRDITQKINRLPLKYLDSRSHGDVMSRITNDVDLIGQTLNNSLSTLVSAITLFIGSIIMMFVTNWIMALTAIGASLLGFVLMGVIMSKSQKYFVQQQQSLGKMNGHIEEIFSGHNVVKAYNGERQAKETFDKHNTELYKSAWKSQFLSGLMMPIMMFIGNFGYVAVCVVGAVLAVNGTVSFGVISAFIIYVRLFTQPLSQMAQAFTSLQSASAGCERVFEFLEEKEMADESHKTAKIENVKGDVEFSHIRFGYNPEKPVIKDFSASIKAGQKVAIVGPTGAGKTTLVNLLMRFYDVDSGTITIDGVNTQDMKRENVHELFSMVLQDTWIFNGTIKENIAYDKQGVTLEQVVEASKACGLDHFVHTLPHGYDTILDENTTISAGQRQLITIARAMVQNSPMLILDEATSSVDTRTEVLIQQAMDKLTQNRTSFVIAHRLSTIKNSDLILVMRDGDIVEKGTHDELLAQNGFYADLYNSQFEEAEE